MIRKNIKRGLSGLLIFIMLVGLFITAFPTDAFAEDYTVFGDPSNIFVDVGIKYVSDYSIVLNITANVYTYSDDYKRVFKVTSWRGHTIEKPYNFTERLEFIEDYDFFNKKGVNMHEINLSVFDKDRDYTLKLEFFTENRKTQKRELIETKYIYFRTKKQEAPEFDVNILNVKKHEDLSCTLEFEIDVKDTGRGVPIKPNGSFDLALPGYNYSIENILGSLDVDAVDSNSKSVETWFEMGKNAHLGTFNVKLPSALEGQLRVRLGEFAHKGTVILPYPKAAAAPKVTEIKSEIIGVSPTEYAVIIHPEIELEPGDKIISGTVHVVAVNAYANEYYQFPLFRNDDKYIASIGPFSPGEEILYYINLDCESGYHKKVTGDNLRKVFLPENNPIPPSVKTLEVSKISTNQATLTGKIEKINTPNLKEVGFIYSPLSDYDKTGTFKETVESSITSMKEPIEFKSEIDKLSPGTEYVYQAYGKNSAKQTSYGEIKRFTTVESPEIANKGASKVGSYEATLTGDVISTGNASAIIGFIVSNIETDPEMGTPGLKGNMKTITGNQKGQFTMEITALYPSTTYYYKPFLISSMGTVYGETKSFTTNKGAYAVDVRIAELQPIQTEPGEKNLEGTYKIEREGINVTKTGFAVSKNPNPIIGKEGVVSVEGTKGETFSGEIKDLEANTDYYYKAYVSYVETSGGNIIYSNQGQFKTPKAPTKGVPYAIIRKTEVKEVASTTAEIETDAYVSAGNLQLFGRQLCYSKTDKDPKPGGSKVETIKAGQMPSTGKGPVTTTVTDLEPNTLYYLRCVTETAQGEYFGEVVMFITNEEGAPSVRNDDKNPVENIKAKEVTVKGKINPNGSTVTKYGVEYGMDLSALYWNPERKTTNKTIKNPEDIKITIDNLETNAKYYYRLYGESEKGTSYGGVREFEAGKNTGKTPKIAISKTVGAGTEWARVTIDITEKGTNDQKLSRAGVVYSEKKDPKVMGEDSESEIINDGTKGTKVINLRDLKEETVYYARGFGMDKTGEIYYSADTVSFKTGEQSQSTGDVGGGSGGSGGVVITDGGTVNPMEDLGEVTPETPKEDVSGKGDSPGGKSELKFTDVKSGDWFYEAVKYVYEKKLMEGTAEDKFSANTQTTRSMIVTILHRQEGSPKVEEKNLFSDAEEGKWYTDGINWAGAKKIVSGYQDGRFGHSDNLTREQLVTILYNYAKYKGMDVTKEDDLKAFADKDEIAAYALPAMKWAVKEGIITGTGNNNISPKTGATRAQVATILQRFIGE